VFGSDRNFRSGQNLEKNEGEVPSNGTDPARTTLGGEINPRTKRKFADEKPKVKFRPNSGFKLLSAGRN
jgi:hypothetical protein